MDDDAVGELLDRARAGDREGAFHGLRELDSSAMPEMQLAFREDADPEIRTLLVEVIWQRNRSSEVLGFLAEAWEDAEPEVWKQALDGIVAIGSPEAGDVLGSLAVREEGSSRLAWIEEAIEQIRFDRSTKSAPRSSG